MIVVDEDKIVKNPLVSVRVHSYNQEQYIEQCLDSILSQKTDFEYEIVLANNPSEDRTKEICIEYQKRYPDKIKLLLREQNLGFFANFYETGRMCRGKYIARCDADDYWCDEYKLQKQVDVMEKDASIGLCHTRSYTLYEDTSTLIEPGYLPYNGFKAHLLKEHILTLTVMHRRELYERYINEIQPENKGWLMEDTSISLWYSFNSKIYGLDDISTVYRVISDSISHPKDYEKMSLYNKSLLDIRLFFYNMYCPNETDLVRPLFNDYYWRNINAAYASRSIKKLFINLIHYRYTSLYELSRNLLCLFKLIVKKFLFIR